MGLFKISDSKAPLGVGVYYLFNSAINFSFNFT